MMNKTPLLERTDHHHYTFSECKSRPTFRTLHPTHTFHTHFIKVAEVIYKNNSDTTLRVGETLTIPQSRFKADLVNYRAILALNAAL
jgi:hypothetical protein